jgi:hypothetical protein
VSTHLDGTFRTLQLRATAEGGSEGLLSVWHDPPAGRAASAARQPTGEASQGGAAGDAERWLPAGASVLRRLEGTDADRRGRTVVALVRASAPWTLAAIEARVLADGLRRDPVVHTRGGTDGGEARLYRGLGREFAVTVLPHPAGTAVVAHLVEAAR